MKEIIRKIPIRIRKNGHVYVQLLRLGDKAIYQQTALCGKLIGHEVFKIKIMPEKDLFGVHYPKREGYPADNDFGVTAWSTGLDYKKAVLKFNSI